MFRIATSYAMLLLVTMSITGATVNSGAAADTPNVILCMADDQGWGDTGYNGHPVLKTPNLDQMAREGLRFDRFYAGSPVCSPTRGSCLTGRDPYRYGIYTANSGHMKPEEVTLAELLREQGYSTGHFGKWHLGTLTKDVNESNRGGPGGIAHFSPPWENGFDSCFSTEAKVPTYWKPGSYDAFGTHYWTGPEQMVPAEQVSGDDSVLVMDQAAKFIEQSVTNGKPFFVVIWFHAPHLPVVSAPPYTDGYHGKHKDYYGCLTALDQQMGRLREKLDTLSVADNTMLWYCSDNGPEGKSSAPGTTSGLRGRKRSLYEGGVRVPGLLVWPSKITKPRTVEVPCVTDDYVPTILDALALQPPAATERPQDGVSLMPLIVGEMTERPQPILFESGEQLSLTDNRFKLYSPDRGKTYQLYDLIDDPGETTDLAKQHPDKVAGYARCLAEWRASCQASATGADYE